MICRSKSTHRRTSHSVSCIIQTLAHSCPASEVKYVRATPFSINSAEGDLEWGEICDGLLWVACSWGNWFHSCLKSCETIAVFVLTKRKSYLLSVAWETVTVWLSLPDPRFAEEQWIHMRDLLSLLSFLVYYNNTTAGCGLSKNTFLRLQSFLFISWLQAWRERKKQEKGERDKDTSTHGTKGTHSGRRTNNLQERLHWSLMRSSQRRRMT